MTSKNTGRSLKQALIATGMTAMIAACGGGSGSSDLETGQLNIGLTDAEGDFLSYNVDVLSLSLEKADGTQVETVPLSTRVDFSQYTEMTEFFSAATVPSGVYTKASITLDYSDAEIVIENDLGDAVAATAVDTQGNSLSQITLSIQLQDGDPVAIKPGVPANMIIDFDLQASNTINSYDPGEVEVDAFLLADLQWEESRELRARGHLTVVDTDANVFGMELRPFWHRNGRFGDIRVSVDGETVYEINGESYEGDAGLAELAALGADTPIVSHGFVTNNEDARTYTAENVYAGSSVAWADQDAVIGTVIARSGDTLTVKGRFYDHETARTAFNSEIQVSIADTTGFTKQTASDVEPDKNSVSVGQRIFALGQGGPADPASAVSDSNPLVLDANEGLLRLLITQVQGSVASLSPLVMDLANINKRPLSLFDFSGTGIDSANDADPDNYEINTQSLSLSSLTDNSLMSVRGFVAPFGQAPEDFIAQTVIDPLLKPLGANLRAAWDASADAVTELSSDRLVIDTSMADDVIFLGGHRRHILEKDSYTLVPARDKGTYAIKSRHQKKLELYRNFADFSEALAEALAAGESLKSLHGKGKYDIENDLMLLVNLSVTLWPAEEVAESVGEEVIEE